MNQVRYNDYGTPIGSKASMEPLALIDGIGPKYGFDTLTYSASSTTITLASSTTNKKVLGDKNLASQDNNFGVITPDGILTNISDTTIPITNVAVPTIANRLVMVFAKHQYLESTDSTPVTIFEAYFANTNVTANQSQKILNTLQMPTATMETWFTVATTYFKSTFDKGQYCIIGLYALDSTLSTSVLSLIPYHYKWPANQITSVNFNSQKYLQLLSEGYYKVGVDCIQAIQANLTQSFQAGSSTVHVGSICLNSSGITFSLRNVIWNQTKTNLKAYEVVLIKLDFQKLYRLLPIPILKFLLGKTYSQSLFDPTTQIPVNSIWAMALGTIFGVKLDPTTRTSPNISRLVRFMRMSGVIRKYVGAGSDITYQPIGGPIWDDQTDYTTMQEGSDPAVFRSFDLSRHVIIPISFYNYNALITQTTMSEALQMDLDITFPFVHNLIDVNSETDPIYTELQATGE